MVTIDRKSHMRQGENIKGQQGRTESQVDEEML